MRVVPFTNANVYGGLAVCHGVIRDQGDHLCLEYELKDGIFGWLHSRVRRIRLPVADILSVAHHASWLGPDRIVIETASLEAARSFPGRVGCQITLYVAYSHGQGAKRFVDRLHEASPHDG
jgi:hypothetical protein